MNTIIILTIRRLFLCKRKDGLISRCFEDFSQLRKKSGPAISTLPRSRRGGRSFAIKLTYKASGNVARDIITANQGELDWIFARGVSSLNNRTSSRPVLIALLVELCTCCAAIRMPVSSRLAPEWQCPRVRNSSNNVPQWESTSAASPMHSAPCKHRVGDERVSTR